MEITLTIRNFESYLPRKDYVKIHWVRFEVDFLSHPDFFDISPAELKVFIHFICIAAKIQNSEIRMNIDHTAYILQLKNEDILSAVNKLNTKRWDVKNHDAVLNPYDSVQIPISREEKKRKEKSIYAQNDLSDFDFFKIYGFYPRKIGRLKGIRWLQNNIKNKEDYEKLDKAVNNYAMHVKNNKTDQKYIKHFSTWVTEYTDWVILDEQQINYKGHADLMFSAIKKFGPDEHDGLKAFLGDIVSTEYYFIGGRTRIGSMPDNETSRVKVAEMIRNKYETN